MRYIVSDVNHINVVYWNKYYNNFTGESTPMAFQSTNELWVTYVDATCILVIAMVSIFSQSVEFDWPSGMHFVVQPKLIKIVDEILQHFQSWCLKTLPDRHHIACHDNKVRDSRVLLSKPETISVTHWIAIPHIYITKPERITMMLILS